MTDRPPVLRGATAVAVAAAAGYSTPEGGSEARLILDPDHRAIPELGPTARERADALYLEELAVLDPVFWADESDDWLLAVACALHDRLLDGDGEGARWGTAPGDTLSKT